MLGDLPSPGETIPEDLRSSLIAPITINLSVSSLLALLDIGTIFEDSECVRRFSQEQAPLRAFFRPLWP